MTTIMTRPMHPVMSEWMPTLFDNIFEPLFNERSAQKTGEFVPQMNVRETKTGYEVEMAVPGMTKENLEIHLEDADTLSVSAEKCSKKEQKSAEEKHEQGHDQSWLRREFYYNRFSQKLTLPDDVDTDAISANLSDGILLLTLPKKAPVAPEKISRVINID